MSSQLIYLTSARMFSVGYQKSMDANKGERLTYDTRTNLALFPSFTAADYVAAQRLR
ncbi:hypothetical protein RND71_015433 [Anisodus tanguticus]|uniref:Uncharacterized protein n=1 Tax=Anisodus tanguticus TaxID=243964 RepID=A0AAE1VL31_9SOLA|nr:hypothetical protein RND71_015433 [Anisodus tanguticus]